MDTEHGTGRIFHIESLGALDGPGLRLVLFLQGCPHRCPYCHNPEGRPLAGGRTITVDEVLALLARRRAYYRSGGLTLSGGEPLMQPAFCEALLHRCREAGIHTALDTTGCPAGAAQRKAVAAADLVLLDIKDTLPDRHEAVFGYPLSAAPELLAQCRDRGQRVWLRHVIYPGMTDSEESIARLADIIRPWRSGTVPVIERVELLPFSALSMTKYRERGEPFPGARLTPPDDALMARLTALLDALR